MFYSISHTWEMKWIGFKPKDHNIGTYRINRTSLPYNKNKK